MRNLAMRGAPWTDDERQALLAYCHSDVVALTRLLSALEPHLTPQALLRGAYMQAVAWMEWIGVPLDMGALHIIRHYWDEVKKRLINRVDHQYGVYSEYQFKNDLFEAWLITHQLPWPQTATGRLDTQADTFRDMALLYPCLRPLAELKATTGKMMLMGLTVGSDGYNRTLLSPFQAKTGRNQPSTTKFIFGPATWIRSHIRPRPGYGLAYIDWSSQEFGIAAVLSGDHAMLEAYESGDCYLAFAKQANAVPADATKATHSATRELFKQCVLATQYGMSPLGLARRINRSVCTARYILERHYHTYKTFWEWSDAVVTHAGLYNQLHTRFGWTLHIGPTTAKQISPFNPRSLRNFPMQATGAEMLRLACIFATQHGIEICAPVHDALLIQAPLDHLEHAVAETQRCMTKASAVILDGFELRTEAKIVRYPERYSDARGVDMWRTIWEIVREIAPEVVRDIAL
jgi:DNA polymerase I